MASNTVSNILPFSDDSHWKNSIFLLNNNKYCLALNAIKGIQIKIFIIIQTLITTKKFLKIIKHDEYWIILRKIYSIHTGVNQLKALIKERDQKKNCVFIYWRSDEGFA